ncbi:MAG TPA: hypothetical protein VKP10_11230 [Gemmatimonadales bacterium]|nr:hypothetical protein [Gemmatimonadales bacterium]
MLRRTVWRHLPLRAATLVFTCLLPACTAWHLTSAPPQEVIAAKQPVKVRIVRQDRSRVELSQPKVEADSIVGTNWDVKPGSPPSRAAIALADVRTVEVRETDTGRIIALVVGVGSIIALIVGLSGLSESIL